MPSVADRLVEVLSAAGVARVYGLVGDSLNGITDSLRKHSEIQWMPVRHEEVAAFAAGADAEVTGNLAVCAGSCGPGNLHLINGLFNCHRNRVPVLAIAAHIPSDGDRIEIFSGDSSAESVQRMQPLRGTHLRPRACSAHCRDGHSRGGHQRGVAVIVISRRYGIARSRAAISVGESHPATSRHRAVRIGCGRARANS